MRCKGGGGAGGGGRAIRDVCPTFTAAQFDPLSSCLVFTSLNNLLEETQMRMGLNKPNSFVIFIEFLH